MCGRFAITLPPEALRALFAYRERPNFPPRYNIAPTQPIPIVRAARENGVVGRHFALARWAFLPGFAKDPRDFPLIFNARAEGLGAKASFRNALRRRRCLVPADAFYEWHRGGPAGRARSRSPSQAYLARRVDGATMGLAALWETWAGPNGEEVDTACIVTTEANALSAAIHPRLPVVLEPGDWARWLDPDDAGADAAAALLRPPADDALAFVPVGDAVGSVGNDGPEIQQPIGPPLALAAGAPPSGEVQPSLF